MLLATSNEPKSLVPFTQSAKRNSTLQFRKIKKTCVTKTKHKINETDILLILTHILITRLPKKSLLNEKKLKIHVKRFIYQKASNDINDNND